MKKRKKNKKEIVINKKKFFLILLFLILIVSIGFVKKVLQNDTFYSIKIGELILNNGIDMWDHFSIHNIPYTYPHWLFDVFIYLIYSIGSFEGIYIATIGLNCILLFVIFLTSYKISGSFAASFIAGLVGVIIMGLFGFATARAQMVTFILFALEILFIESYLKSKKGGYLIGLLLISLAICNMHVAVWPFYFILFLPYLAEGILAWILKKRKKREEDLVFLKHKVLVDDNIPVKMLLFIMFISLFTGLITPIGDTPYTYFIKTSMGDSQKYIMEHQMIAWYQTVFPLVILGEIIIMSIVSKVKFRDICLLLGLLFMTILSVRHMGLFAIIVLICFARTYKYYTEKLNIDTDKLLYRAVNNKIVCIVLFTLVTGYTVYNLYQLRDVHCVDERIYPVGAVEYIKNNMDPKSMRVYEEYIYGSYLLLNDIPVFIDSRADLYTKPFNHLKYDIFDDYININTHDFEGMFTVYKINYALLYKKNVLNDNRNYKKIYEDDYFCLFERIKDEK